jgi:hypothetical protein
MKLTFVTRICSLFIPLLFAVAQSFGQFEGVVESRNMTIDDDGTPQQFTITMAVKKNMVRVQTSSFGSTPGVIMIYRADRRLVWLIDEQEHTYREMLLQGPSLNPDDSLLQSREDRSFVRKSGKSKKILGYATEQLFVKRGESETELWATKALTNLATTLASVLGADDGRMPWSDELSRMGYYPLVAHTRLEGRVVESSEVTRISAGQTAVESFELPPGYKRQAIEQPH